MCLVEGIERSELENRLYLALEQHRQHHNVERRGLAETRADADVVGRHVGQEDALSLEGALADEALAEAIAIRKRPAFAEGIAGQKLEYQIGKAHVRTHVTKEH